MPTNDVIRSDEDRKKITSYLHEELNTILDGASRKGLEEKWSKWRRQAEARPEKERKTYPWDQASNVMPPLTATNVNGVYSALKSTFSARKPFWDMSSDDVKVVDQCKAVNAFLDFSTESAQHLNLRKHNNTILYDLALMGNKFVKIPWDTSYLSFKRRDTNGNLVKVSKKIHDSPSIFPLRMEDYFQPLYFDDPQRSPWIANRHHYTWHELLQRQDQGIYTDVDKVFARGGDQLTDAMKEELSRRGISTDEQRRIQSSIFDIFECHLYWDVDGDGFPEDIVLFFDPVTETILREEFNDLGIRDTVNIPYLLLPDQLYAMGVGWMSEYLQDEIEALHNMRVDGTQLSMLQMYASRRGSGVGENEEFRPLKNIQTDGRPQDDFMVVKFPDIGASSIQAEMLAKEYSDRFTGASDYQMGFESRNVGTKATASGTMFLAQQGSKIFQAISENVEEGYSQMGQILTFQLIRNKDRVDLSILPDDLRAPMQQFLQTNIEDIPAKFKFKIKTTDINKTEEAKRQMKLTLVQLYSMYAERMFSLLPIMYNQQTPPQIQQVAMKFFTGATEMMSDVLKDFGEVQTEKFLPYTKQIEMMVGAIESMQAQQVAKAGGTNVRGNQGQVSGGGAGGGMPAQSQGGPGYVDNAPATGGEVEGAGTEGTGE